MIRKMWKDGNCKYTFDDGDVYEGEFKDDNFVE
jgi:hypothetical protein